MSFFKTLSKYFGQSPSSPSEQDMYFSFHYSTYQGNARRSEFYSNHVLIIQMHVNVIEFKILFIDSSSWDNSPLLADIFRSSEVQSVYIML